MRVLLVNPRFPPTFWGQEYAMPLTGRRALLPPLGLLTVAALLPPGCEARLADLNVRPLDPAELDWADVLFVGGMLVQRESMLEVAAEGRRRGKPVVIGGAYASTSPDSLAPHADCVVVGEAEELVGPLAEALARGEAPPPRLQAKDRPDVRQTPVPRYDLIDADAYLSVGVQFSRGCPFNCEFCDIIEIFGRKPRTKSPEQLLRELDAVYATGFRGSLFVVDDNFIGNKSASRGLLGPLAAWMRAHGDPFDLFTEASVNLARDEAMVDAMVDAGFTAVFLGIETPSPETLRAAQKAQNTAVELDEAVRKLVSRGLEVMAGFIVGFDEDDAAAVERLTAWIAASPIPLAMAGVLIALPGTQLERRLAREGRLLHVSGGDNFCRTNFVTRMDERELLEAFAALLAELYEPDAYFDRAARSLELCPDQRVRFRRPTAFALACLARSVWGQGVRGSYRGAYWRYLARVARRAPGRIERAFGLAISGDHMIRYTAEEVLPRLRETIAHLGEQERAARAS